MNLPISLKTLANVLGIVLLIALVAPFVVYAVPGVVGAEHSFVVLTASMTPAIAPGDVVIVDERDPATIAEGDVITFVRGGNEVPVTHRVIDVVDGPTGIAFETQGDANGGPDASLVPGENVLGVVAITIPYIGYVIQFADSPAGFAALVVVPFGLLLLSELWSIARARNAVPTAAERDGEMSAAAEAAATPDSAADRTDDESIAGDPSGVSLDAVVGGLAVLLAFAPYSVYVASQSTTALSLTVAIATTALLLGGTVVWASATGLFDRSDTEAGTDVTDLGAVAEEEETEVVAEEDNVEAVAEENNVEAVAETDDSTTAIEPSDELSAPGAAPLATDGAGEAER